MDALPPAPDTESPPRRSGPRPRSPARPRPEITLDQLHTFLAVAERQHVSAAADALGISQGSVSTVVHRLEQRLGLPLFQRVGRNVQLTDVGRALRPLATRIFDDVALIDELCTSFLGDERGEIAVAAGHVVGSHRVPGWLAPFVAAHAQLGLHLRVARYRDMIVMLQDGEVDIIFAGSEVHAAGLESMTMECTEMALVAAPGHPLARSRVPARELNAYRHLEHERGTATHVLASQLLGEHGVDAEAVELEEGALLPALRAGLGFAVMPRALVENDLAAGRLVVLPCPGPRVVQCFTAARREGVHTPAVELLWQHLREVAGSAGRGLPDRAAGS
jgi:DNA-binding transcriptional LysR family regulator